MLPRTRLVVPVTERDHHQGPATAAVTLVQYEFFRKRDTHETCFPGPNLLVCTFAGHWLHGLRWSRHWRVPCHCRTYQRGRFCELAYWVDQHATATAHDLCGLPH